MHGFACEGMLKICKRFVFFGHKLLLSKHYISICLFYDIYFFILFNNLFILIITFLLFLFCITITSMYGFDCECILKICKSFVFFGHKILLSKHYIIICLFYDIYFVIMFNN